MQQELLDVVARLRKKGDYQYILSTYVERSLWIKKLQSLIPRMSIENFTDFNYSTCFTMYINISDTDAHVGTEKFTEYIRRNFSLYRIQIQVSAIAPYAVIKYVKYSCENEEIQMRDSFAPFLDKHDALGKKIVEFLSQSGLTILNEEMLLIEVRDIMLELRESNVTVYHCLFEDECS